MILIEKTFSIEDIDSIANDIAQALKFDSIISLSGEIGVGKTTLAQKIISKLMLNSKNYANFKVNNHVLKNASQHLVTDQDNLSKIPGYTDQNKNSANLQGKSNQDNAQGNVQENIIKYEIFEHINSPTFSFVNQYQCLVEGKECQLYHCDLYRIQDDSELLELEIEENLGKGLFIIEWPEKIQSLLPNGTMVINISYLPDDTRLIKINYK